MYKYFYYYYYYYYYNALYKYTFTSVYFTNKNIEMETNVSIGQP